jgi:hypothetical protein
MSLDLTEMQTKKHSEILFHTLVAGVLVYLSCCKKMS